MPVIPFLSQISFSGHENTNIIYPQLHRPGMFSARSRFFGFMPGPGSDASVHSHTVISLFNQHKKIIMNCKSFYTTARTMYGIVLLLTASWLLPSGLQAQAFDNPGFEISAACDPANGAIRTLSCIDGWWNFYADVPDRGWYKYGTIPGTGACSGLRGGYLGGDDSEQSVIATVNPYYGLGVASSGVVFKMKGIHVRELDNFHGYIYVGGSHAPTHLLSSGLPPTVVLGRSEERVSATCADHLIEFGFNYDGLSNIHSISDFPYLIFFTNTASHLRSPGDSLIVAPKPEVVIDEVSRCEVFHIDYEVSSCDELCIDITYDPTCLYLPCGTIDTRPADEFECELQVVVDGIPKASFSYFYTHQTICIDDLGPGAHWFEVYITHSVTNQIDYTYQGPGKLDPLSPDYTREYFYICPAAPAGQVISTNTTWTPATIPNGGYLGNVTVQPGVKLTIAPGTVAKFCPGSKLTVQKGARLDLHGTLTSACDGGWQGVEVTGDPT